MKRRLLIIALLLAAGLTLRAQATVPPPATTVWQVNASWTASTDCTVASGCGFNVYRATGSGAYALLNATPLTVASYVDTTVTSGTTYNYEIQEVRGAATGAATAPVGVYVGIGTVTTVVLVAAP